MEHKGTNNNDSVDAKMRATSGNKRLFQLMMPDTVSEHVVNDDAQQGLLEANAGLFQYRLKWTTNTIEDHESTIIDLPETKPRSVHQQRQSLQSTST